MTIQGQATDDSVVTDVMLNGKKVQLGGVLNVEIRRAGSPQGSILMEVKPLS
jgi:hypothetical protein